MTDIEMLPLPSWTAHNVHVPDALQQRVLDYARAVAEHNVKALQADMATLEQHLANAMGEVDRLDKRAERLAEALRDLLSRAPGGYECGEFHHSKDDRHGPLDACPPMQRWHAALDDARDALRDYDQEVGNG